jgi:hypothetical protein
MVGRPERLTPAPHIIIGCGSVAIEIAGRRSDREVRFLQSNGLHPLTIDLPPVRASVGEASLVASIFRHPITVAMTFGLVSLAFFLAGIGRPGMMYYDEPYFVPEARAFLQGVPNPNPYVPPLVRPP